MPLSDFNKIDEDFFSTVLEDDFSFDGSFVIADSLIVKGYISGKIQTEGLMIIGPDAVIEAEVYARDLQCFGRINGDMFIEKEAYFHCPSVINGNIDTPVITIEKGCLINGKIKMTGNLKGANNEK